MEHLLRSWVAGAALILSSAAACGAAQPIERGGMRSCDQPRSLREVAQDDTTATADLCGRGGDPFGGAAPEQTVQAEAPPAPKINLTMEQHHIIKEIVLKDLHPKNAGTGPSVSIGDRLPDGTETQPFPPEVSAKVPQIKAHRFVVMGDRIVIVAPKDNTVADVIE